VTRTRWTVTLLTLAAACSGGSEKPGAVLRGPGALAVFDGIVAHGTGTLRPYLAVANERGDELRLVDATDNHVVTSPGLIFPLSVPSSGRPLFMAATDLHDGALVDGVRNAHDRTDALAVIAAGSNTVGLVDTWTGHPTVFPESDPRTVTLPADAEVLSMVAAAAPVAVGDGASAVGVGRILVGLSGGRLAVIDYERDATDLLGQAIVVKGATVLTGLGFDPVSLSQGVDAEFVYAASREPLPGGKLGVAELRLTTVPAGPADWTLRELDARVPTEQVAAVRFDGWVKDSATSPDDFTAGVVDRVVAVPIAGACGAPPKPVRCGLLAIDVGTGALAPNWVTGEEDHLLPIPIPAPVSALLATGRVGTHVVGELVPTLAVNPGAGTFFTTGLASVSADDGKIYLVDLARWTMASDTSLLVGAGRTRATGAKAVVAIGTVGALGLWGLDGVALPTALDAEIPARVRVTPGLTPTDSWTLSWRGVLPALERRAAVMGRDGAGDAGLWLAIQIDTGAPAPVAVADLTTLHVQPGDLVELDGCPSGTQLTVASVDTGLASAPGGAIRFTGPASTCLPGVLAVGDTATDVATVRASELLLVGAAFGYAGRPPMPTSTTTPEPEFVVPGRRIFYVTDSCTSAECTDAWPGLTFPFPTGNALGLRPAFLDAALQATLDPPSVAGTAIVFSTASGLTPSGRRPTVKGTVLAAELPSGLAMVDPGGQGTGAQVYASFTAGLVMSFSSASAPSSMVVIR